MINQRIKQLIGYAVKKGLVNEADVTYVTNRILEMLALDEYEDTSAPECAELEEILSDICDYAFEKALIPSNTVVYRDLFDTKIMGALTPMPSTVIAKFDELYKKSPEKAT